MRRAAAGVLLAVLLAAQAAHADDPPRTSACLPSEGQVDEQSIRGVRLGTAASVRRADGGAVRARAVSYCVDGAATLSFALDDQGQVVLVRSTARGDSFRRIGPGASASAARKAFPRLHRLTRADGRTVYRAGPDSQMILGLGGQKVLYVAVADRLLLEDPATLRYYLAALRGAERTGGPERVSKTA